MSTDSALPRGRGGRRRPENGPPATDKGRRSYSGPIPFAWVAAACRLPGRGPHVAFALRFLRDRFRMGRDRRWTLDAIAKGLKVSDDSVRRGLQSAERAGLISVSRRPGRLVIAADVTITKMSQRESDAGRPPLRGPVPWAWLSPAVRLSRSAVQIGLACWLQAGWYRSAEFELGLSEWTELGLSRFSARRGLQALERAGLVSIIDQTGKKLTVTVQDAPNRSPTESSEARLRVDPMSLLGSLGRRPL